MVAADGDSAELVASALGDVNLGDQRAEVHAVDVSTDTNGDGTATVTYDEEFADSTVFPLATMQGSDTGDVTVQSAGSTQATVEVSGSGTTSGPVTVTLLVIGQDRATGGK